MLFAQLRRAAKAALIAPVAGLAALVTGCGATGSGAQPAEAAATRVFDADNGQVTIPADPKRVVATGYAVPVLIEAGAALVGISTWKRGLPLMSGEDRATYDGLEKVAGETAAETNYEAIAKVKPDLIVIGVPKPVLAEIDMERLKSVAPVVAIGPTKPSAWRELSRRQADAAGRGANFDQAKAAYEKKAAELAAKYEDALAGVDFGHVGSYGEVAKGSFQREFADSWGTNIAQDIGVTYYGQVKEKGGGSLDVSETPSIEELSKSLGEADAITYSVQPDGTPNESVAYVLKSELWKNLPAVKAGRAFPLRYTEAATYDSALKTLDAVDQALAPLLGA
ncbi:ABC transporter substrate-binding protein [Nonomuraea sp. KC401]|uniref:ABC transporter substrate-binding protein n=1 Tax=unclassified Nonomuraea TaxID=2593643 RepID=UPI0010FDCAFA|nr:MULTISPECIES: ABC transporter substrate-binding protein [unclassified Nonomuraea]NBE98251.1 ABC transporter substrate-binding protein [Nonomuraea sp. K271]TLF61651.1 ABC transporter substrate-binding protein [Nonomuraea sp. KC401]